MLRIWHTMKFKLRCGICITIVVSVVLLLFQFGMGPDSTISHPRLDGLIESGHHFNPNVRVAAVNDWVQDSLETHGVKTNDIPIHTCIATTQNQSNADIDTFNIWDSVNFEEQITEYKVKFPDEKDYDKLVSHEPLTVLLILHSHNDPGWQETVRGYYEGSTKHILDNIVVKLTKYPDFKIVWAETVFLSMWYEEASKASKRTLKDLIDSGRLDIVTGGWVMPDEASTHYYSIIDQLIEGHQWLLKTFGVKPRINWSIDPFGHSGTVPYLWQLANFQGMVVQRVHQAIKDYLGHYQKLEFLWRQNWDTHGRHDIMTHMMPYQSYDTTATCGPNDLVCRNFKLMGNRPLHFGKEGTSEYRQRMEAFLTPLYGQFREKAKNFQHNTIFVPLGGDFAWQHEIEWEVNHNNFTKFMDFMNSKPEWNIKVKFGTLTEYFNLIDKVRLPKPLPTITGDFFVYSEYAKHYWSGYFTSRPLDKFLGREVQSALKAADVLHMLASFHSPSGQYPHEEAYSSLERSRRDLGLYQHHDAITGTAKPHVVTDYESRLTRAFLNLQNVITVAIYHLVQKEVMPNEGIYMTAKSIPEAFDLYRRDFFYKLRPWQTSVLIFNPTAFRRREFVSVVVDDFQIKVYTKDTGSSMNTIGHQVNPVWKPDGTISKTSFEVSFPIDIPPWALRTYTLSKATSLKPNLVTISMAAIYGLQVLPQLPPFETSEKRARQWISLENSCLEIQLNSRTGMIARFLDKTKDVYTEIRMSILSYKPERLTGAYLFNPVPGDFKLLSTEPVKLTILRGKLFSTVRVIHPIFQTTITVYNTNSEHPSCWAVGIEHIITLKDTVAAEILMRVNTNINNQDVLYTDGNGLAMVKHRRVDKLPKAAAYYPMTSMATIQSKKERLTFHAAQPHAVASPQNGYMEILLDRTFRSDDGKGLNLGIENNEPAPSRFLLSIENGIGESDTTSVFYPTLESWRLNDILQNPLRTVVHDNQPNYPVFNPIIPTLPCDANVISYRPLHSADISEITAAFILEKRGFSCGNASRLHCPYEWDSVSFESLFNTRKPDLVKEMSLSYIDVKKTVEVDHPLELSPNAIKSYLLHWKKV